MREDPGIGGTVHAPFDLFTFCSGDPEDLKLLKEEGVFCWWGVDGFKLSFWRPLSCLTHIFDHLLLGGHPVLMHGHSILWMAILLVVVDRLYRQFCGRLRARGMKRLPGESPGAFAERVAREQPHNADAVWRITALYERIAYQQASTGEGGEVNDEKGAALLRSLRREIRRFRPPRKPPAAVSA